MTAIPRCMSTQHPDNVTVPFFATSAVLAGEDEIREAFYAYSHLGCDEQMWDVEGKEIDTYVVKKLFSFYPDYFSRHILGEELRLTLRVPNPSIEKSDAKILIETLESIPRSYDTACLFYGRDVSPIFEVILPMTTSARCVERVYRYYVDHIIQRQYTPIWDEDITIAEWVGKFAPSSIQVIPLIEDVPTMIRTAEIVRGYVANKNLSDQRVFLARSDTAMNYGLASAALANKIALYQLDVLSAETGIRMHPIMGFGSAPFRGGLSPTTVERIGHEYPSAVTFTIQSAFKFDYPLEQVNAACRYLKTRAVGPAAPLDVERALALIERYSEAYRRSVVEMAPQINRMAKYVPARRSRKLHIGLFGYARSMGQVKLPRAISFTCSLYSLGLPPELIAFDALNQADLAFLRETYPSFDTEITEALRFADLESPLMTESLRAALEQSGYPYTPNEEHLEIVRSIRSFLEKGQNSNVTELVSCAANLRHFLG